MERSAKRCFFDGHKREDVIKYKKTFLKEMKVLSPYFVELGEDGSILPKEYPEDCKVVGSNQKSSIMITYDKSTFFVNHGRERCGH